MKYYFDRVISRKGTGSVKWDLVKELFGNGDAIPMWVADMDFESPKEIIDAIESKARHGIYGYTIPLDSYYGSIIDWYNKRHNWNIKKEWLLFSPGVVPAINMLIQTFSLPGEKIILQLPVYYPFMKAVKNNERVILNNPLEFKNGRYCIDFEDLREKAKDPLAKILILCNPHNPVGRVWSKEDLIKIGEICIKNDILVISDEIHSDLIYDELTHIPFGSLSEEFLDNSIICNAPSKTFNLAGLQTSYLIIKNDELNDSYRKRLDLNGLMGPNLFGIVALEAAYRYGEDWLNQLMDYIQANYKFMKEFIDSKIPEIDIIQPEATYMVWLDCRKLGMSYTELRKFMRFDAGLALDEGYIFGQDQGAGFERINIACPRSILNDALVRLENAVDKLR